MLVLCCAMLCYAMLNSNKRNPLMHLSIFWSTNGIVDGAKNAADRLTLRARHMLGKLIYSMSICDMSTYWYRLKKGKGPQHKQMEVSSHWVFTVLSNSDNLKSQASPLDKDIAPHGNSVGPGDWIRASSEVPRQQRGNHDSVWRHRPQCPPNYHHLLTFPLFHIYLSCNVTI